MEEEFFFSGYCKQLDAGRMVAAVSENGVLTEVDCSFGACPYEAGCPIAKQLQQMTASE